MKRIGIDLGGTKIEGVVLDGDDIFDEGNIFDGGNILVRERIQTPRDDYSATVDAIAGLVRTLEDRVGRVMLPVGIGTPGAWVADRAVMKNCNSTWLNGRPLRTDLETTLQRPVALANDANCFALSEAVALGIDRGVVFGVILGTGVGGGLVVDGRLVTGINGIGGEWGHTPLPYFRTDPATSSIEAPFGDRPCYCGRSNCVEQFLSGPGVAETHRLLTGRVLPTDRIPTSGETFDLYVAMLARSLAQLVNIIDPDVIVLGGGVSNVARLYTDVPSIWDRYAFSHEGLTRLVQARMGDSSGVLGAARLTAA